MEEFYAQAAARLMAHLADGRDVVLLAEGDPLFYSSYMHMHKRISGRFRTEIVPGITSVSAASAALAMPLVRGRRRADRAAGHARPRRAHPAAARRRGGGGHEDRPQLRRRAGGAEGRGAPDAGVLRRARVRGAEQVIERAGGRGPVGRPVHVAGHRPRREAAGQPAAPRHRPASPRPRTPGRHGHCPRLAPRRRADQRCAAGRADVVGLGPGRARLAHPAGDGRPGRRGRHRRLRALRRPGPAQPEAAAARQRQPGRGAAGRVRARPGAAGPPGRRGLLRRPGRVRHGVGGARGGRGHERFAGVPVARRARDHRRAGRRQPGRGAARATTTCAVPVGPPQALGRHRPAARGGGGGDFAIAIYNPASAVAAQQLADARDLLLAHRDPRRRWWSAGPSADRRAAVR